MRRRVSWVARPKPSPQAVSAWGFPVGAEQMNALAHAIGEKSVLSRTGGAPTLAIGMASIFRAIIGGDAAMKIWYHFALMFEALIILTTVDVATRIGRFLIQELGGRIWTRAGDTKFYPANIGASLLFAVSWGYFLYAGVKDPLGGVNSLWPLFGIANQLLSCVALCLGATILIKAGRARLSVVVLGPLLCLGTVTFTAGIEKIVHPNPRIGFLAMARSLSADLAAGNVPAPKIAAANTLIFNNRLDAMVAGLFLVLVVAILAVSLREWVMVLSGRKPGVLRETPPVWLPKTVIESEQRRHWWQLGPTLVILGALVRELSGEAAAARSQLPPDQAMAQALADKYDNPERPTRCC